MIHISKNQIPDEIRKGKAFLYGGGITGKVIIDIFRKNNVEIEAIIDDDEGLQGKKVQNILVISFEQFMAKYGIRNDVCVVLTSIYGKTILKKMEDFPGQKIYELFEWYNEILGNMTWITRDVDIEKYERLKKEWGHLKKYLADEQSVETLDGIIRYLKNGDLNDIASICSEEQHYFIAEVRKAINEPLYIVDGGAYRGELLYPMRKYNLPIEKWYCFEPDDENYGALVSQAEKFNLADKQECIKKGLWSKNGKVYFEGGEQVGSRIVPYETKQFVEVTSIDEYIGKNKCNFIKMDIEGAEQEALKGAINVIKRERPILAISIYHTINDYWQIPKYLIMNLTEYKFYVRHHALINCETVLYCIPH